MDVQGEVRSTCVHVTIASITMVMMYYQSEYVMAGVYHPGTTIPWTAPYNRDTPHYILQVQHA